jgi:hypothetical protein
MERQATRFHGDHSLPSVAQGKQRKEMKKKKSHSLVPQEAAVGLMLPQKAVQFDGSLKKGKLTTRSAYMICILKREERQIHRERGKISSDLMSLMPSCFVSESCHVSS